jgi:hypothetical protein
VWAEAISMMDATLAHPAVAEDVAFGARFMREVARVVDDPSPMVGRHLVETLRPYHWLRANGGGRALLIELLTDRIHDGRVLGDATRLLRYLGVGTAKELADAWLSDRRATPISNGTALASKA